MSKFSKFLSGKSFYFVLAFCLIAIGAVGFLAVSSAKSEPKPQENTNVSQGKSIVYSEPQKRAESKTEAPAQNPVSSQPKTTSSKAEPPVAESFASPVESEKIIKIYDSKNLQFSSTYGDMRIHLGADIEAKNGETVKACGDGTVKKVYSDELLGKTVEIDHGNGVVIKYCGLSDEVFVKADYTVKKGEKIGTLSGTPSESMDTPHIHIEATISGKYTNPAKILKID